MVRMYEVTASVDLVIACEHCGRSFPVTVRSSASGTRGLANGSLHAAAISSLKQDVKNWQQFALVKRCPHCGWMQRWMQRRARNERAFRGLLLLPMLAILSLMFSWGAAPGLAHTAWVLLTWALVLSVPAFIWYCYFRWKPNPAMEGPAFSWRQKLGVGLFLLTGSVILTALSPRLDDLLGPTPRRTEPMGHQPRRRSPRTRATARGPKLLLKAEHSYWCKSQRIRNADVPLEALVARLFEYGGYRVLTGDVGETAGTIEVEAKGEAIGADYTDDKGKTTFRYTGARVSGTFCVRLPGKPMRQGTFRHLKSTDFGVFVSAKGRDVPTPADAPFGYAYSQSLLGDLMRVLAESDGPEPLVRALGDSDRLVRTAAVPGLKESGDPRLFEALEPFLKDARYQHPPTIEVLGAIADDGAIEALIDALKKPRLSDLAEKGLRSIARKARGSFALGSPADTGERFPSASKASARHERWHKWWNSVQPGVTALVKAGSAPLKVGRTTLAVLDKGSKFHVLDAKDGWVKATIEKDGKRLTGWVRSTHLRRTLSTAP